jgi:TusA-related sulfurtransferase
MERATSNEPEVIELDARGFEPPQPLMKTLEAIATLPPAATLRLHTRWKPAMLFPELEKRGFVGESQEQSDGSCITHIRRC